MCLITGSGHGNSTYFLGNKDAAILHVDFDHSGEVKGRIVHLLSCRTAQGLGPALVSSGCIAFIGYDDNFLYDPRYAKAFFECDCEIEFALMKGGTVEQAHSAAVEKFNSYVRTYARRGDFWSVGEMRVGGQLLSSPKNRADLGNGGATI